MIGNAGYVIRLFRKQDQKACKQLILDGLAEHFGEVRYSLNSDLNDIAAAYTAADHMFFVAEADKEIIGTGAIVKDSCDAGRIVRLSVQKDYRRLGIARAIVSRLLSEANSLNLAYINVETNLDWAAAINLYENLDFRMVGRDEESIHFQFKFL